MAARLGVEITPTAIRAVRLGGWMRTRATGAEIAWDGEGVREAVGALRDRLGGGHRVAIAIGVPFLFTKHVKLPPLAAAEKQRVLTLEPERYFPVRGEDLVVAARDGDGLVFAAREALVDEWIAALEAVGHVDLVEPAPAALARALVAGHVGDATVLLNGGAGHGVALVEIRGGRVELVRRVFGGLAEALAAVPRRSDIGRAIYVSPADIARQAAGLQPLPMVRDVRPAELTAFGAALGVGGPLDQALVPPVRRRRIASRRRRDRTLAAVAAAAALLFALGSLSAWRGRTAARLEARLTDLRREAAPALALQARAEGLERESRTLARLAAERVDPLAALLAIGRRLPPGTYLRSLRSDGAEWQLDGYARDAARLVPLFEDDPRFDQARFLRATARARVGGETYETFSLALRFVPAP